MDYFNLHRPGSRSPPWCFVQLLSLEMKDNENRNNRNEKVETFACFDNESELAVRQAGWNFRASHEIDPHEISAAVVRAEVTFQRSASRRSDGTFYLLRTLFATPYSERYYYFSYFLATVLLQFSSTFYVGLFSTMQSLTVNVLIIFHFRLRNKSRGRPLHEILESPLL